MSRTLLQRLALLSGPALLCLLAAPYLDAQNLYAQNNPPSRTDTASYAPTHGNRFTDGSVVKLKGVNSPDRENMPVISADGNIIFFNSTRFANRPWGRFSLSSNRYDDDIYFATRAIMRRDEEVWNEPVNLGPLINSSEDDGVSAISPDGQTVYFCSLKKGWELDGGPFYQATLKGSEWTEIKAIAGGVSEFFINRDKSARFRLYGAAISPDGKDFYFATTVNSPTGQHQIWVSHFENGTWSYPSNLGPAVNTGDGSYAPFIAADGKTLFFTSRRPEGLGGDDIYVSEQRNGEWQPAMNLGSPINTEQDDAFISLPASGDRVYLASSRDGDEDIYRTPLPEMLRPTQVVLLSGSVVDKTTNRPIEANVVIEDLQTGLTIFNASSNSESGRYTVVLQPGRDYGISVSAPGYVFLSERYTVPTNTEYKEISQDFQVEKLEEGRSFVVNNIFFEYNADSLSEASRPELDRLIALFHEYPDLKLEVGGHTDNIGSANFNQSLSLRRANAVKQYMIERGGIDPTRLDPKGYGFSKPAAPNETEDGRRLNRRTEFTVLNM